MVRAALFGLVVLISMASYAERASAGPYSDDLAKCWVQHSSTDDKILFTRWMFAELSLNPALQSMTSITDDQRDALSRAASNYYQRLMFTDCRQQLVDALKYEGPTAIIFASKTLGGVATREMMNNPKTMAGLASLNTNFDKQKMANLLKEAGLTPATGLTPSTNTPAPADAVTDGRAAYVRGNNATGDEYHGSLVKCSTLFPTGQGAAPGINCAK